MAKAKAAGGEAKAKSNKPKSISKSKLIEALTDALGEAATRKQVKQFLETLADIGHKELKKSKIFTLPGFAKFTVVNKPARPAREGVNPFTGAKQTFKAKPASKSVRARPIKAIKDSVA